MPYKKCGHGKDLFYIDESYFSKYHKIEDLSIEELNDQTRDFSIQRSGLVKEAYVDNSDEILPSGLYKVEFPSTWEQVKIIPMNKPKSLKLFEIGAVREVIKEFNNFKVDKKFSELFGGPHKRGVLLYGPPGTGKTSAINMIINSLEMDDALIFYIDTGLPTSFLKAMQEEKRLKIFIFEELTQTLNVTNMGKFLKFLDGEDSVDNTFVLATTNYPEQLPGNLVDRPGRFDKLIKVEDISLGDRKIYLEHFLKRNLSKAEVNITKNYSMSYMKELINIVLRKDATIKEAVALLDEHKDIAENNFSKSINNIGFNENDDD